MKRSSLMLLSAAALLVAACQQPGSRSRPAGPGSEGAVVSAGLTPLARFVGDWEGTIKSLSGNFKVARRLTWIVPDSWLLEQTIAMDPLEGKEVDRTATLYSVNPTTRQVEAHQLLPHGRRVIATVELRDDGFTRLVNPVGDSEGVPTLTQTSLFNGREWNSRSLMLGEDNEWHETDRLELRRRPRTKSE